MKIVQTTNVVTERHVWLEVFIKTCDVQEQDSFKSSVETAISRANRAANAFRTRYGEDNAI